MRPDEYFDHEIKAEGETTRRHFDVVAEKMTSERNLVLDRSMATAQQLVGLTASNAGDHVAFERRLDNHDRRLEKSSGPTTPSLRADRFARRRSRRAQVLLFDVREIRVPSVIREICVPLVIR